MFNNLNFDIKMLGEAILHSSIQFAIGSVVMSSAFSVRNFAKDQETLQNAADALSEYLSIALMWTVGTTILLYCNYGISGLIVSVGINLAIVFWIYRSYIKAFKTATEKYKLTMPSIRLI